MATFLILGTYSNKGVKGLIEKDSDRKEALKTKTQSVGAKFELICRKRKLPLL